MLVHAHHKASPAPVVWRRQKTDSSPVTVEEQKKVTKIVEGTEVKETKTWKYFHLSDYKYISYLEFKSVVSEVSRGLLKLDVKKGAVFNIYAQTR